MKLHLKLKHGLSNRLVRSTAIKRSLAFVLAVAGASACVVLPSSRDEILQDWKMHVNRARDLSKDKRFDESEKQYREALRILSKIRDTNVFQALTHRELAILSLDGKNDKKAMEELQISRKFFSDERTKDPDTYSLYTEQHVDVLTRLADIEKALGLGAQALVDYKSALNFELDNEKRDRLRLEILTLEDRLGLKRSIEYKAEIWQKVLSMTNAEHHFYPVPVILEADRLRLQKDCASARQYLLALIDLCKEKKDGRAQASSVAELLLVYYQEGELNSAEQSCKNALRQCSRSEPFRSFQPAFYSVLSFVELRRGMESAARMHFDQALQTAEQDSSRRVLVRELEAIGEIDESAGRYELASQAFAYAVKALSGLPQSEAELKSLQESAKRSAKSAQAAEQKVPAAK